MDRAVIVNELRQLLLHGNNGLLRKRHFDWWGLPIGIVTSIVVIIAVVRIVEPVVRVIIRKGISNKEISAEMIPEPEMIFVPEMIPEMISVPGKALSSMFAEVMAVKTTSGEHGQMAATTSEMAAATTSEMAATTTEMAVTTSDIAATASNIAAAPTASAA